MKRRSSNTKKNVLLSANHRLIASPTRTAEQKRRETFRIGDASSSLGLPLDRRGVVSEKDDGFQTGSYTSSKSSRQTFGTTGTTTTILEKKKKPHHPTKPSGTVRTKSGFWSFGGRSLERTDMANNDENKSIQRSKQSSKQSRGNNNSYNNINNKTARKQEMNGSRQEMEFDIEPSQRFYDHEEDPFLVAAPNNQNTSLQRHQRTTITGEESNFSEDHSDSTLSTKEQHPRDPTLKRLSPRTPPPPPSTSSPPNRRVNHFMALAHHGDWGDLPETPNEHLIKSPDRKPRHLDVLRQLTAPAESSSSSDSDDAGTYISGATPIENRELLELTDDEEDDDETDDFNDNNGDDDNNDDLSESNVIRKTDDHTMIQRKVSRMSSDQLRRWDGYQDQVVTLVQTAMPDAVNDVPKLLRQFSGREAELIQTLQTILQRSPQSRRDRKSILPKSKGIVGTRRVSYLNMDAIATIAAANVLDDTMLAVKPEYVVDQIDESVENSSSGEEEEDEDDSGDDRSYYSDDDDDASDDDDDSSEESSFDEDDDDLSSYDKDDSSSEEGLSNVDHSVTDEYSDRGDGGVTTVGDGSFWDGYDD